MAQCLLGGGLRVCDSDRSLFFILYLYYFYIVSIFWYHYGYPARDVSAWFLCSRPHSFNCWLLGLVCLAPWWPVFLTPTCILGLCTLVPIYIIYQVYFKVFTKPVAASKSPQQVGRAQLGQCGRAAACVSMCGGLHDFIMSVIILIQSHTTTFE